MNAVRVAIFVLPLLLLTGCAEKKKETAKVPRAPDISVGPNCVMGAKANSKSCEVVRVDSIPALLCDQVLIKLACIPAPKSAKKE